jgi:nitroreductase
MTANVGSASNADLAARFSEIAEGRYSCRAFQAEPIAPALVDELLALAQRAPSDCNTQPWTIYLVENAALTELRARLFDHVQADGAASNDLAPIERYEGTYLDRRRACGWGLYEAVGIPKGDRAGSQQQALLNFRFFDAPHVAVMTVHASLGERGLVDLGIYLGFFLLGAQSLDIAAVPQAAPAHYAGLLHEALGIPADQRIACVVAFGRADTAHPANQFRTQRADLGESVVRIG